jgi:hypothetical protein
MSIQKQSVAKATTASVKKATTKKTSAPISQTSPVKTIKTTGTAKSTTPKKQTSALKSKGVAPRVSHEQIATVAYRLSLQNQAASAEENWLKAEAKLLRK